MFTRFELLNVATVVLWNDPLPAAVIAQMKKDGWRDWSRENTPLLPRKYATRIHKAIAPFRNMVSELGADEWAQAMVQRIILDTPEPFDVFGGPEMFGLRCAIAHLKWLGEDQLRDEANARVAMAEAA